MPRRYGYDGDQSFMVWEGEDDCLGGRYIDICHMRKPMSVQIPLETWEKIVADFGSSVVERRRKPLNEDARRAALHPDHPDKLFSYGAKGPPRELRLLIGEEIEAADFGAGPDRTLEENRQALDEAIAVAETMGGGIVRLTAGFYGPPTTKRSSS